MCRLPQKTNGKNLPGLNLYPLLFCCRDYKHRDQKQFIERRFYLGFWFQRGKIPSRQGAGQQEAERDHMQHPEHEVESGLKEGSSLSEPCAQGSPSPARPHLLNLPQQHQQLGPGAPVPRAFLSQTTTQLKQRASICLTTDCNCECQAVPSGFHLTSP